MENMREMKMNFWRHKTNEANRGFFPTDLKVVEMEMKLIDFSEVDETDSINICDLSGGTGQQIAFMRDFLKERGIKSQVYYNEVTKERYDNAKELYGNKEGFHLLMADFFTMKVRTQSNKRAFTIIRNNPPYGYMDYKGSNIRMEDMFFVRNAEMQVPYGIQIFELPIHQLIENKNLIRKVFYRYENVNIFMFPEQHFDKKQVCVIGTLKMEYSNDIELAEEWRQKLVSKSILTLDQVDEPVIKLDKRAVHYTKPIELFRDGKVSDLTLSKGFNAVFDTLLNESIKKEDKSDLGLKVPLIEQLPGHVSLDIYSGQYDGLIGDVLVKGGVKKNVTIITEKDGDTEITTEIERLDPFVELTSSNGKVFVKEHKSDE